MDKTAGSVHWSFWAIGVFALIWSALGAMNFVWQMDAEALASYPPAERMIIDGRPVWATIGFAIAVFGGLVGAVLLLFRQAAAMPILVVSLLGVIVATAHAVSVLGLASISGLMPSLSALIVAVFLVWYARRHFNRGP